MHTQFVRLSVRTKEKSAKVLLFLHICKYLQFFFLFLKESGEREVFYRIL